MLYNIILSITFASVFHGIRFKVRRLFVVMTSNFFFCNCYAGYLQYNHNIQHTYPCRLAFNSNFFS